MTEFSIQGRSVLPSRGRKVLFVAATTLDIAAVLREPLADFEVVRSQGTAETLALVISGGFSHVVVDLSTEDASLPLLIPLLASSDHDFKLYVLARAGEIGKYLRIRGVDRAICATNPVPQLRAALGATPAAPEAIPVRPRIEPAAVMPPPHLAPDIPVPSLAAELRGRFTSLVSALYKNTAFVLLAVLFAAFCFYGALIAYFLLASGWGAPVSLSSGHELVNKAEQQIAEMRVNANLTSQRYSEAQLEASEAERARADSDMLVGYMLKTIDGEITARTARRGSVADSAKRQTQLKAAFEQQLGSTGLMEKLNRLYSKRVIDKRTYDSAVLGMLEASQRLSAIETELATAGDSVAEIDASLKMLEGLKGYLRGDEGHVPSAAAADLLLLTKQAVDARSAFDQSQVRSASADARLKLLRDSRELLARRISEVEASALGRAISQRVDVIFVPYGNDSSFKPGAPLYSCVLTFILCRHVGEVGSALPGEATAVHPFFGKPLRGTFVEAKLSDPSAASEEIIHAGRPPFLF